jgi:hypothetical protein
MQCLACEKPVTEQEPHCFVTYHGRDRVMHNACLDEHAPIHAYVDGRHFSRIFPGDRDAAAILVDACRDGQTVVQTLRSDTSALATLTPDMLGWLIRALQAAEAAHGQKTLPRQARLDEIRMQVMSMRYPVVPNGVIAELLDNIEAFQAAVMPFAHFARVYAEGLKQTKGLKTTLTREGEIYGINNRYGSATLDVEHFVTLLDALGETP